MKPFTEAVIKAGFGRAPVQEAAKSFKEAKLLQQNIFKKVEDHGPGSVLSSNPWNTWRVRCNLPWPTPSMRAKALRHTGTFPRHQVVLPCFRWRPLDDPLSFEVSPEDEDSSPSSVAIGSFRDCILQSKASCAGLASPQKKEQICKRFL